jgi:hypothetical protein
VVVVVVVAVAVAVAVVVVVVAVSAVERSGVRSPAAIRVRQILNCFIVSRS